MGFGDDLGAAGCSRLQSLWREISCLAWIREDLSPSHGLPQGA